MSAAESFRGPDWKPARSPKRRGVTRTQAERDQSDRFKQVVCASGQCIAEGQGFGECDGVLQAAHVIPKATLRNRGLWHLVWETRDGVALCERHHRRHDGETERLPMHLLPPKAVTWAEFHGFDAELERFWPPVVEGKVEG